MRTRAASASRNSRLPGGLVAPVPGQQAAEGRAPLRRFPQPQDERAHVALHLHGAHAKARRRLAARLRGRGRAGKRQQPLDKVRQLLAAAPRRVQPQRIQRPPDILLHPAVPLPPAMGRC